MTPAPILEPDRDAILLHLETVFGGGFDGAMDGLIELAWTDPRPPHALVHAALFGTDQIEEIADRAVALNRTPGCNVYLGAALRKPSTPAGKRAADADFHCAPFAWTDIDDDAVDAAVQRCREAGVLAHLTVVTGRRPHTRAQFWWRLAEASRDPGEHRALCAALAAALGGDPSVVNPGRVLRLGGSVAWPTKAGRVLERTETHAPRHGRPGAYWPSLLMRQLPPQQPALPSPAPARPEAEKPPCGDPAKPAALPNAQAGLAIGSLSVEATLAAIRSGHRWHDHVVRLVAHWIARGLSDAEIVAMASELTLPGWTVNQTKRDLARMIEGGRRKWNVPNPAHEVEDKPPPAPLAIRWRDGASAAMIPRRRWIVGSFALRGQLTVLVAPPGAGKSTLSIAIAVAAVTGREDIVGEPIHERVKAWVWNNEDDEHELDRRLNAIMLRWGVAPADLRGRLGLNSGSDRPLVVAKATREGAVIRLPDIKAIAELIRTEGIGLLIVDPFVETHEVNENDNAQIKTVAAMWREVARRCDCAVVLVHHTGKPPAATPDAWTGSLSASRGASSLAGVARIMRTLFGMSERDAERLGINVRERHLWVRIDDAKANLSLAAGDARWFRRESVCIANGEEVGVLAPSDPTENADGDDQRERVRQTILREVASAWAAWLRDQSRLPLTDASSGPDESRKIRSVIPPLAGCSARTAVAVAEELIVGGEIVPVQFIHNRRTKRGLKPRDET